MNKVIPDAYYINIIRDGRDAAASTLKRWKAPLDIKYIFKKARYVPVKDMPYYAVRYLNNRIYKIFSKDNKLSTWGPRFKGIDEMLETHSLISVCAEQWRQCVMHSEYGLNKIDNNRVFRLKYENFVQHPIDDLKAVLDFLNVDYDMEMLKKAVSRVSSKSVGNYKRNLTDEEIKEVEEIQREYLQKYKYI
ncbi:MAG: sulfotransferase [bacterium]